MAPSLNTIYRPGPIFPITPATFPWLYANRNKTVDVPIYTNIPLMGAPLVVWANRIVIHNVGTLSLRFQSGIKLKRKLDIMLAMVYSS